MRANFAADARAVAWLHARRVAASPKRAKGVCYSPDGKVEARRTDPSTALSYSSRSSHSTCPSANSTLPPSSLPKMSETYGERDKGARAETGISSSFATCVVGPSIRVTIKSLPLRGSMARSSPRTANCSSQSGAIARPSFRDSCISTPNSASFRHESMRKRSSWARTPNSTLTYARAAVLAIITIHVVRPTRRLLASGVVPLGVISSGACIVR